MHGLGGERVLMRIHIGERDKVDGKPLYEEIVQLLRRRNYAGATVFRGIMSFGASARIHTDRFLELSTDLPIVVECIETEERIQEILPELDRMIGGGLITLERVRVIVYRADEGKVLTVGGHGWLRHRSQDWSCRRIWPRLRFAAGPFRWASSEINSWDKFRRALVSLRRPLRHVPRRCRLMPQHWRPEFRCMRADLRVRQLWVCARACHVVSAIETVAAVSRGCPASCR